MKSFLPLLFAVVVSCFKAIGQELPGFGLTYFNYIDPMNNPGDDLLQQTSWKMINIDSLNAPLIRQMQNRDLTWRYMEQPKDSFHFLNADSLILLNPTSQFIGSLFYESGTKDTLYLSPWKSNSSIDRQHYVSRVVSHYGNAVDFWEIGNENSHSWKAGILSPAQYADALMESASTIYTSDSNSKIILSGLATPEDEWNLNDSNIIWLDSVLSAMGSNPGQYFDIVDCHLYTDWFRIPPFVKKIRAILNQHGCYDKQIMVGENGVSSSYSNTSPLAGVGTKGQAEQVFIRMCLAVASGASHSSWFSHLDGFGTIGSFRGYGSIYHEANGLIAQKPSWYSLQLLYNELVGFDSVQVISEGDTLSGSGNYVIRFEVNGEVKYVAWNIDGGTYTLSGLPYLSAQLQNTVCKTTYQSTGLLNDEWPVLTNGSPDFSITTQSILESNLSLSLDSIPILITLKNSTGFGINSFKSRKVSWYPNPFTTSVTFQMDHPLRDATITLYNLCGQVVRQTENFSGTTVTLHRENLPVGLYFFRLMANNETMAAGKLTITD